MNLPLIAIVLLIIQIFTYQYLVKLNECLCAQSLQKTEMANLKYLQYVVLFFIVVNVTGIMTSLIKNPGPNETLPTGLIYVAILYFVLLTIVSITLILQTYRLYRNMPETCECAVKWPRYYLYILALISILALPGTILAIVGLANVIRNGTMNRFVKEVQKKIKNNSKK